MYLPSHINSHIILFLVAGWSIGWGMSARIVPAGSNYPAMSRGKSTPSQLSESWGRELKVREGVYIPWLHWINHTLSLRQYAIADTECYMFQRIKYDYRRWTYFMWSCRSIIMSTPILINQFIHINMPTYCNSVHLYSSRDRYLDWYCIHTTRKLAYTYEHTRNHMLRVTPRLKGE